MPIARIMRPCGHRSSCHCRRSALPTLGGYAVGMPKTRLRKPVMAAKGKSKSAGDAHNEIARTAESALPPKKPPAPSVRHPPKARP